MANPPCMSGDERPAVFVGTMLTTGDSVALCDECLVGWAAALLNVMTGVDPTPFLKAISEGDGTPPAEPDTGGGGENSAAPPSSGPPSPNGDAGPTSRRSRAAGTVDARSDEERAAAERASTPAA